MVLYYLRNLQDPLKSIEVGYCGDFSFTL